MCFLPFSGRAKVMKCRACFEDKMRSKPAVRVSLENLLKLLKTILYINLKLRSRKTIFAHNSSI